MRFATPKATALGLSVWPPEGMPSRNSSKPPPCRTLRPKHMYLKVCAEVFDPKPSPLSQEAISEAIPAALTTVYGIVGGATLLYEEIGRDLSPGTTILRTPVDHHVRIWAALTLLHRIGPHPARFTVVSATPFLFALDNSGA